MSGYQPLAGHLRTREYGLRSQVDDVGQEETGCDLDLVQYEKSTSQFLGSRFSHVKRDDS